MHIPRLSFLYIGLAICGTSAVSAIPKKAQKVQAKTAKPRPPLTMGQLYLVSSTAAISPEKPSCVLSSFPQFSARLITENANAFEEKGEFESTDEYVQRITKFGNAIDQNDLVSCSNLNLSMPISKYDADEKTFEFSVTDRFEISYTRKFLAPYTGQTAMGLRFQVKPAVVVMHRLSTGGSLKSLLSMCGVLYGDKLKLKVDPQQAATLREKGILSVAGKLERPWVTMEDSHEVATIAEPTEWYFREFEEHMAVTQVRVMMPDGTKILECVRP